MKRRAIVVVLDGLRRDMVGPETTPELHRFSAAATRFAAHRSVFPSATRVVSACFATGALPAKHGLQGNSVALMEDGQLVAHDVGRLDFMDHWRAVRGHTFAVPTMAERLARAGQEAMVFNNVSPGAARAHDPDGYGWVYNRAGSFGPDLRRLGPGEDIGDVTLDTVGDRRITDYFLISSAVCCEKVRRDLAFSGLVSPTTASTRILWVHPRPWRRSWAQMPVSARCGVVSKHGARRGSMSC
jgi:hypothetical protein